MQLQFDLAGASSLEPIPIRLNRIGALDSRLVVFSDDEPASTSSENALAEARRRLLTRFGPKRDERRHDPVSQPVMSFLSSQTYDAVSAAAYIRLQVRYPHSYAFVIATHVLRVAPRLGWIPPGMKTAEKACQPLMALVPSMWDPDDLYGMHWP